MSERTRVIVVEWEVETGSPAAPGSRTTRGGRLVHARGGGLTFVLAKGARHRGHGCIICLLWEPGILPLERERGEETGRPSSSTVSRTLSREYACVGFISLYNLVVVGRKLGERPRIGRKSSAASACAPRGRRRCETRRGRADSLSLSLVPSDARPVRAVRVGRSANACVGDTHRCVRARAREVCVCVCVCVTDR